MRILLEHVVERTAAWQRNAARQTVKVESTNSGTGADAIAVRVSEVG
jgi:hypothetical protein